MWEVFTIKSFLSKVHDSNESLGRAVGGPNNGPLTVNLFIFISVIQFEVELFPSASLIRGPRLARD